MESNLFRIKRSYDQVKSLHKALSWHKRKDKNAVFPELPKPKQGDPNMVHKIRKCINDLIGYFEHDEKNLMEIKIFLELTDLRGKEVKNIMKCGWGYKGIGGRYKSSKFAQFLKSNFM